MREGARTYTNSTKYLSADSKNMTHTSAGVFGKTAGTMMTNDMHQRIMHWASNAPAPHLTQRIPDHGGMRIQNRNSYAGKTRTS